MTLPGTTTERLVFLDRERIASDDLELALVVPLNQVAMRDVLNDGLPYVRMEEFLDYSFANRHKEELFWAFDRLFRKADEAVAKLYEWAELSSLGPFSLFYMYLRANIENEIIYLLLQRNIVRKYRPKEVVLYGKATDGTGVHSVAQRRLAPNLVVLLRQLAEAEGFRFVAHIAPGARKTPTQRCGVLLHGARRIVIDYASRLHFAHRRKRLIREVVKQKLAATAWFLQTSWGVFYYSQFFERVVVHTAEIRRLLRNTQTSGPGADSIERAVLHAVGPAVQDLSALVGVEVTLIVNSHLSEFVKRVPAIVAQARALKKHLDTAAPDFVLYTNLSEDMLPIQIALEQTPRVTRILKTHGDSLFDVTAFRKNEVQHADLYLTEFPELAEYFRKSAIALGLSTRCASDAIRLNTARGKCEPNNKLVYVPWLFLPTFSFEIQTYPAAFFYRIQLRILETLARQRSFKIIYKCLRSPLTDYQFPVPDYIREKFPNITISYQPLQDVLREAECCLLDAPSSAMWDAINMRVPCHSLVWRRLHVRDTAVDCYRKYLTFFESDLDVADKVHSVLQEQKFFTITEQEAAPLKRTPSEVLRILQDSRTNGRNGRAQCQ